MTEAIVRSALQFADYLAEEELELRRLEAFEELVGFPAPPSRIADQRKLVKQLETHARYYQALAKTAEEFSRSAT